MTFDEVLPALKQGRKIRRLSWSKNDGYPHAHIFLKPDVVTIESPEDGLIFEFEPNVQLENYRLNIFQILSDDWEIGGFKYPTKENVRDSKINKLFQQK
jgi:hypothetical protein